MNEAIVSRLQDEKYETRALNYYRIQDVILQFEVGGDEALR
jgi:hypothetical protein